ncbi:Asp-tRNA(Asn)/Glu-tRNA(Gln) amidotransferase subunit GatA [candidate division TA06 bacterium]|nr:Asp-tRNA(Asn)/Glu-tRNA(Gln) amidotransferase subunit GatA [candidate division TA06 bacterium]
MELCEQSAFVLHQMLVSKEISCREILLSLLNRIHSRDLNAYITLFEEEALKEAERVDQQIKRGEDLSPWTGIPLAVKDNICIQGKPTTCGSKILTSFQPPYDASVISKLKEKDCLFIGKTNMDEFAMGSSNENSHYHPVRNPWDPTRVPGGSSGGSVAAVASGQAIWALGSDTGGSIRQPASFCGVVGLKPTYGRVSRYGLVAFASSLDQIGPIARTVQDCALLLEAIAGYDSLDSTSLDRPVPLYSTNLKREMQGMKMGIPREFFGEGLDSKVEERIRFAIHQLEEAGVEPLEISLPHTEYAIATYYLIATAEASSNLARYDGVRYGYRTKSFRDLYEMQSKTRQEGFGDEVKRRIMLGTYALSAGYYEAYYGRAQKARTLIRRDFDQAFEKVDFILTPTAPTQAFKIGEKIEDPLQMYLSDIYTVSPSLAGVPALSLPLDIPKDGLPIGLQFIGKTLEEEKLLQIAFACEEMKILDNSISS